MAFTSRHSAFDDDGCHDANCRLPTCIRDNMSSSNAWSYVGEGRGGYMVVEKLVYVGDGQGDFSMDEHPQSSGLRQLGSGYCNKAALCRIFVNGALVLVLLSLLCGMALLIPAVADLLDSAIPVKSRRHPLKNSKSRDLIAEQKSSMPETFTSLMPDTVGAPTHRASRLESADVQRTPVAFAGTATRNVPASQGAEAHGCDKTCAKRIWFASENAFQGKVGACLKALMAVKSAGVCTGCTLWNDGCQENDVRKAVAEPEVTTKLSTTLRAHRKNTALASTTKALDTMPEWAHAAVATPPTDSVAMYDCESGFFNCVYSWTIEKKQWCTLNSQRACPLYDCNSGFDNCNSQWSHAQKKWCQHNKVGRNCILLKK